MFGLGPLELMVIGVIAVMLYGKQLPDVGLKAGKGLAELRRQWSTISRDLDVTGEIKNGRGQTHSGSRSFRASLMMRKMHRRVQLLIHQVLHPMLDHVIFCDQKNNETRTSNGFFGCAVLFFGVGWTSFHVFTTRVFAVAGSEGRGPPCSLISMGLGALPLCTALF